MKRYTIKRLLLGLLQHFTAFGLALMVAEIIFNSYMTVDTMEGKTTYHLNLFTSDTEFEDTEEFADIFQRSVSDIVKYVVVKDQMEQNGSFAINKEMDINRFAQKNLTDPGTKHIFYELDELIKWGMYGVEYAERSMSLHDFVNYFGNVIVPENFGINTVGDLYFKGFLHVLGNPTEEANASALAQIGAMVGDEMIQRAQLEDMAFSYIMANTGDEVKVNKEEDGTYTVTVKMINNRYLAKNKKLLYEMAQNWIEYLDYQHNLVKAVETVTANYDVYQKCNEIYEENSNLKYTVRMITEEGQKTFSNEVGMEELDESDITDYFSEFNRYLIYYPENLSYMGNNPLTENEIYNMIRDYAYPETTHIWIAVDTTYTVPGDAFYHANTVFQRVIPNMGLYTFWIVVACTLWFVLALYLTVTAGAAEEEGKKKYYLNTFDKIWTEVFLGLVVLYVMGCIYSGYYLESIANQVYDSHFLFEGNSGFKMNGYLSFGLFGFVSSMLGSMLWYSLVRRCKSANIWQDSLLSLILQKIRKMFFYVMGHKNSVISSLLPYSIFLLANLVGILGSLTVTELRYVFLPILVVLDILVGFYLYRQNSEQVDILEGIKQIRDGKVEHKLETEGLHGQNKETALAVNTIGEGIKNAVRTSVKDEQMKTDLITNVSHDLKTPLTSIVSYIDLLKRLDVQDETARGYIDVLDTKAQRLKLLTDDLVEVSKISSGNIVLNMEILNLTELVKQALGEFSDILTEKQLEAVYDLGKEEAYIYADSRRMWRVIENLFNNVCKYAMANTRVFIDLIKQDNKISFHMKNVSNHKMDVSAAEDLTERFFRGDVSRTTEGSGLGLSIAKSLVQVQGGSFELELDGDLFKVNISFHEYQKEITGEDK